MSSSLQFSMSQAMETKEANGKTNGKGSDVEISVKSPTKVTFSDIPDDIENSVTA